MIGVGYAGPVLSGVEVSECQQISDLREMSLLGILPHPICTFRQIVTPVFLHSLLRRIIPKTPGTERIMNNEYRKRKWK